MEKLYNNVVLSEDYGVSDPQNVPYLKNPPEVIDISVGRQLFVDDFLIEETELRRQKNMKEILYFLRKNRGKRKLCRVPVQKAAVFGMMKMIKSLRCGMKEAGSKIYAMLSQLTA